MKTVSSIWTGKDVEALFQLGDNGVRSFLGVYCSFAAILFRVIAAYLGPWIVGIRYGSTIEAQLSFGDMFH